jgi:hypothetical protein
MGQLGNMGTAKFFFGAGIQKIWFKNKRKRFNTLFADHLDYPGEKNNFLKASNFFNNILYVFFFPTLI